jgi:hypothetical protein
MRLPGRAPGATFVLVGPTTTLLCRRWSNDDIQIAARRGSGLGITSPSDRFTMITVKRHRPDDLAG